MCNLDLQVQAIDIFFNLQDTPMSCEPTLLPEPNHVMLNHLYALSIKDGVMVLSTTQRFKKKYVTSLLYKPMGTRIPEDDWTKKHLKLENSEYLTKKDLYIICMWRYNAMKYRAF